MTFVPFLSASWAVQIHVVSACFAAILGPFALYRTRRDRVHKTLGYVWVVIMALVALSSLVIPSRFTPIGVGPLHVFAAITLRSLWAGVRHAITGNYAGHRAVFRGLYTYGLLIAGAFAVLPHRTLNQMLFHARPELGWWVIAGVLGFIAARHLKTPVRRLTRTWSKA